MRQSEYFDYNEFKKTREYSTRNSVISIDTVSSVNDTSYTDYFCFCTGNKWK